MRRLPIFFLLDVSESMAGDNLRQLQQGLERLVSALRRDPHALESVFFSVIAFAGKPRTLAPLTELALFYPPRLPIGSGTSLGAALEHLMSEMDRTLVRTSAERKGDWKPVVYLMTDGKPTDDMGPSIARWQQNYARRTTLVAIAVGKHVALDGLRRLTENVLQLDSSSEDDFRRFVDWVTQSVAALSRSVSATGSEVVNLGKLDILKKVDFLAQATTVDEDFVILSGRCQTNKLPYLIKYERCQDELRHSDFKLALERYQLAGVFALEPDYDELSDDRVLAKTVNSDALIGAPGCPHCGNPIGFAMCSCGQIMCLKGPGAAICPTCGKDCHFEYGDGEGFDVNRARG